jgi:hypothetical protein
VPEIQPDRALDGGSESSKFETVAAISSISETGRGALSDAELERAIVDAVTQGAVEVARVLAARLEGRRRSADVIPFPRRG